VGYVASGIHRVGMKACHDQRHLKNGNLNYHETDTYEELINI
jgi:hypothetical protein